MHTHERGLSVLALGPESHGGFAGMAQGTRDYLGALLEAPEVARLALLARHPADGGPAPPEGWEERVVEGSPLAYTGAAIAEGRRVRPDLVVCVHLNLLPAAALVASMHRAPVWLYLHGMEAWKAHGPLVQRALGRVVLASASSRFTRDRFLSWAPFPAARAVVNHNPVHAERFAPGSKPAYLQQRYGLRGRRVLLTLGRMLGGDRFKGHDEILAALPRVLEQQPDLAWLVVGDGPDRARIEARVRASGLAQRVVFAGRIRDEEKPDHYRLADAYAMPSCTEGFGIVFLEAAASGLPCLGSLRDGSRDALAEGALGVLVDPGDPRAVEAGLLDILSREPEVRRALGLFRYERLLARTRKLLERYVLPEMRGRRAA